MAAGPWTEFIGRNDFELIEGDVTDITKVTFAMRAASAVIHLAGLVGDPACAVDSDFTRHANVIATQMAKEVAQSLGVYRFLFASSCSVYGVTDKEVSENRRLNPGRCTRRLRSIVNRSCSAPSAIIFS